MTGTTAASGAQRRSGEGSEISCSWNGSANVATGGAGGFDTLVYRSNNRWTWTDGNSRVSETCRFSNGS